MSEPASTPDQPGTGDQSVQPEWDHSALASEPAHEKVALGLAAALVAIVLGAGITLAVWSFGFIASITSFVMAAGAVFFYRFAAGAPPRRGIVALIGLILLGVIATFFLLVGYDAAQAYDELSAGIPAEEIAIGKVEFVRTSMFDGEVLGAYTKDMAIFFGFALLGIWSTLKNTLNAASD